MSGIDEVESFEVIGVDVATKFAGVSGGGLEKVEIGLNVNVAGGLLLLNFFGGGIWSI